jgi:hypothetical protein
LISPSVSPSSAESHAWSEVARICRRVCVLRERGCTDEAETLRRSELDVLLATLRQEASEPAVVDRQFESIFAAEADRVANASVLAELLAPLLRERLPAPTVAESSAPRTSSPSAVPARRPRPAAAGGIADFIDEMIAHEHGAKNSAA